VNYPYTHKGWFWFCPIYLSPYVEGCPVEARTAWLEPLFSLAELFERARIYLSTMLNPEYQPSFMFKITGELEP
jgi:hypothetical protein